MIHGHISRTGKKAALQIKIDCSLKTCVQESHCPVSHALVDCRLLRQPSSVEEYDHAIDICSSSASQPKYRAFDIFVRAQPASRDGVDAEASGGTYVSLCHLTYSTSAPAIFHH